jgi:peptide/nickel transport system substrate-binding protein
MSRTLAYALALATAALVCGKPADAQKSKDTLRFPLLEVESTLDGYLTSGWFHQVWSRSVYGSLISFDPTTGKFVPELAKSWSQPTPTTYEFELRDDIKWHDGQVLDADDVAYTIGWLIDPKTKFRYKADWAWIDKVEKLGSHKVRITSKTPVPSGMVTLAGSTNIYPEHVHGPLENKQDFGARPVGTGLYRVLKLDKNSGVTAERNPTYVPTPQKPTAFIGRFWPSRSQIPERWWPRCSRTKLISRPIYQATRRRTCSAAAASM